MTAIRKILTASLATVTLGVTMAATARRIVAPLSHVSSTIRTRRPRTS